MFKPPNQSGCGLSTNLQISPPHLYLSPKSDCPKTKGSRILSWPIFPMLMPALICSDIAQISVFLWGNHTSF